MYAKNGATKLSIMTLRIMTISAMICIIKTLSLMSLFKITPSIDDTQNNYNHHKARGQNYTHTNATQNNNTILSMTMLSNNATLHADTQHYDAQLKSTSCNGDHHSNTQHKKRKYTLHYNIVVSAVIKRVIMKSIMLNVIRLSVFAPKLWCPLENVSSIEFLFRILFFQFNSFLPNQFK